MVVIILNLARIRSVLFGMNEELKKVADAGSKYSS